MLQEYFFLGQSHAMMWLVVRTRGVDNVQYVYTHSLSELCSKFKFGVLLASALNIAPFTDDLLLYIFKKMEKSGRPTFQTTRRWIIVQLHLVRNANVETKGKQDTPA